MDPDVSWEHITGFVLLDIISPPCTITPELSAAHTLIVFQKTLIGPQDTNCKDYVLGGYLFYGADSNTGSTGHNKVSVFDIRTNLIKYKRNDVRLHRQEEDIAFAYCFLIAGREVCTQFL